MKLLVFACLVALACAYPSRLGTEKCTYGPSYWCENYKQAVECEAIEHCKKFVWKAKEADNCDTCKAAIKQLNTLVTTNSSKVLEIMKNVCAGLSTGATECKFAVDTYGNQIIAALKTITSDSEKLCQELEMCPSANKVQFMKKMLLKNLKAHPYIHALKSAASVKADFCEDCKMVFQEIKTLLEDKEMQKEIIALLESLCQEAGSFAAQCKQYVDDYLPLILDELASLDDPTELCNELGLCNSTKKAIAIVDTTRLSPLHKKKLIFPIMPGPVIITPREKVDIKKSNADKCDSCKAAVKQLNYYVTNNSSKVIDIMENLCVALGSMSGLCKMMVESDKDKIIEILKEVTSDGEKLCQELGMCSSTNKVEIMKKIILKTIKAHPKFLALKSVKEDYCNDCKLVFAELKDILQDKDMQQEFVNALEALCKDLGTFADQCKEYVAAYLPLIMDELATLDDPTELCNELGLCNSTKKVVETVAASQILPAQKITLENSDAKSPGDSVECIICEFAIRELDSILGDNATEAEIEAALEKVCSLLPSTVKSECDAFIEEYGPEIIKLLLSQLQPDQICTELGLCSGQGKPAKLSLKKKAIPNDETCDLCKMVVQYLESVLKSNATEEEIKKALEEICNLLPASLKTECDALIDEYGDLIIKLILGEITPDEVCEALGLCSASKKLKMKDECALGESYWCANYKNALKCEDVIKLDEVVGNFSVKKDICKLLRMFGSMEETKGVKNDTLCQDCVYAIKYLGSMFPKNTTKEQIMDGLKKICTRFPPSVMKECDAIIQQYGDFLVKLLLGEIDPATFCKELGLCPTSLEQKEKIN